MSRLKLTSAGLAAGLVLLASSASAQPQKGFVLDRFNPSERGSEWFVLDSLDLRGHLRPSAGGVVGTWAYNPLVVYDRDGNYVSSLVEHQVFVHPGASLVLWNRVRAALSMPIALYQSGEPIVIGTKSYSPPSSAAGDLRIAADARVFGKHGGPLTGALGVALYLPTGSRDDYTSDGYVRVLPRATVAGDIGIFTYSARVGWHYRALTESFERNPLGSEITFGGAAGVRVADRKLVVGPEVHGSSILDSRLLPQATRDADRDAARCTLHGLRFPLRRRYGDRAHAWLGDAVAARLPQRGVDAGLVRGHGQRRDPERGRCLPRRRRRAHERSEDERLPAEDRDGILFVGSRRRWDR